jgi:hypothetical protein
MAAWPEPVVNAMLTEDAPQATRRYLQSVRDAIESALDRAANLGEVAPQSRSAYASTFLTSVLGANIAAKSGLPETEIYELIDGLRATVRGWATSSGEDGTGAG